MSASRDWAAASTAAGEQRPQVRAAARLPAWPALVALMALSGGAALGYQIIWAQQLGAWLGHEFVAVLAVVGAFFGGLAIGAQALGPRIVASAHPGRWYAAMEAAIGTWALVLVWLMPTAGSALAALIGAEPTAGWHWTVAFAGPLALLLPATAAMGATLPAMEQAAGRLRGEGFAIGGLYAANTAGALAGVLLVTFWLVPEFGLSASAVLCAAANILCALLALRWLQVPRSGGLATAQPRRDRPAAALVLLATTGLLGIGYEVAVVRVLSQVAENTVYTFALLLAIYLLGTAGGGALYQRWLAGRGDEPSLRAALLAITAAACVCGTLALWFADALKLALSGAIAAGFAGSLAAEATVAATAFALPTVAMGMLFSHLCVEARAAGWPLGSALAANTAGAALAAPLVGVLLLPLAGAKMLLVSLSAGYLFLLPREAWRRAVSAVPAAAVMAGAAAVVAFAPPLRFVSVPEGGRLVTHRDGVMAAVSVVEDPAGVRRLHINNREQEGSSVTRVADARQAWLPLLMHPDPDRVLFLGLGTGVTAASAAADPELRVDAVELLPEVIEAAGQFVPRIGEPGAAGVPRVLAADARRFVRASGVSYDVIVADLFHPARSGSGALYTVEHFRAVRERLANDGLFCQWLPLHQLDLETLRSIVRAFLVVYPGALAVLATHSLETPVIGLVAGRGDWRLPRPERLRAATGARTDGVLAGLQLDDEWAVAGSVIAGARSLEAFAGDAPVNNDDHPVVTHRAPRFSYAPDSRPRERLSRLLADLDADPVEVLGVPGDETAVRWQSRLAAYWAARDRFIEAGMHVEPTPDVRVMLAQVGQPLLEVLRLSPDFSPAYVPLENMALALRRLDPEAADDLLRQLHAARPSGEHRFLPE